ncbi:DUF4231 domain-containing protein [Rhizobium leguminosarum]|uniref:DUF4231 domain-containing protein n=1 Tax=Rhizobium leguminosarum TaxID=384 RepID=UPI003F9D1210
MSILQYSADRQAIWSATANKLKERIDISRKTTFVLSITGALVASLASVLPADSVWRTALISTGALALATTGFIASQILTSEGVRRQIRARAAAEALKRETFLFATAAGDYADPTTRDGVLKQNVEKIEAEIVDLTLVQEEAKTTGSSPRVHLSYEQYVDKRIDAQISFYNGKSSKFVRASRWLHRVEFTLAFLAAILTALAGVLGKGVFDFAAIVGVITTCSGAIMAHLQASHYDDLIVGYRAAANKLQNLKATTDPASMTAADLATATEDILAAETNSWHAMWLNKSK